MVHRDVSSDLPGPRAFSDRSGSVPVRSPECERRPEGRRNKAEIRTGGDAGVNKNRGTLEEYYHFDDLRKYLVC